MNGKDSIDVPKFSPYPNDRATVPLSKKIGLEQINVVEFWKVAAIRLLANKQEYRNEAKKSNPQTVTTEDCEDKAEVG